MTEGRRFRLPVNLGVKVSPGKSSGQRSQVNFRHVLTVLRPSRVNFQEDPPLISQYFLLPEDPQDPAYLKISKDMGNNRIISFMSIATKKHCTFFLKPFCLWSIVYLVNSLSEFFFWCLLQKIIFYEGVLMNPSELRIIPWPFLSLILLLFSLCFLNPSFLFRQDFSRVITRYSIIF